ncbi:ROK family transcriptional regulator [Candidatus Rhodobacter oscarellae]|nr:ROK family transcriptional regulator [Candidatus Rhodobacter lobularis]
MRAHNERLVLSLLRRRGPLAKADIARVTGLSPQTVSVIMRALEADGLLVKGDPVRGKVGQPSVPMRLAEDGAYFFGLKVGRRSVELVLVDFLGQVLHRAMELHSYPTPEGTFAFADKQIAELTARLPAPARARIAGLGIAMPFFLWNWADALGVPKEKMAGWRKADIRSSLAERHDFPIYLENDASSACGAEVVFGPSTGPRNFLYFYVGYFIGGGIVLNGARFSGAGNAGAVGPMPVPTPNGVRQLLDVASLFGLEGQLRASGWDTDSMWRSAEGWDIEGDILDRWLDGAAAGIAHAIVSAASIIDFGNVLVDGWIPRDLCERLVQTIDEKLAEQDLTGLTRPAILTGSVGADARALGAAALPLSQRFLLERAGA